MMDYIARYGLEFNPFLKNSKQIILEHDDYKETLTRLNYLLQTKGFGVLTGAPGLGKTTAIRNWSASLNPSTYKVIYSCLSTLTVNEYYRSLATALGQEPAYRKNDNYALIQSAINRLALEKRITPVIIIDEANRISTAIFNELISLFNFEMDSKDRAVILLCGLPYLNNTLNLNSQEPLSQRIIMNYTMEGLNKEDGRNYIRNRLKGAGCRQDVFDEAALEAILNTANGTPRVINKLCNAALLIGATTGKNLIDAETAMQAINDCQLG